MKIMNNFIDKVKPPCNKCPYTLGLIRTVTNPCPLCKENNYQMFEHFRQDMAVGGRREQSADTSCYSSNE